MEKEDCFLYHFVFAWKSVIWGLSQQDFVLLLQNVVVEGVVTGHGHEGAEANPNGVEDLSCSIHPHLQPKKMFT